MNKSEIWKHSAQQRAEQRIANLTDNLETLREQKSQSAEKIADQIATMMFPVAEALVQLTEEAKILADQSRETIKKAANQAAQSAKETQEAAEMANRALIALKTEARRRISRFTLGALTVAVISLPVIGWQLWRVETLKTEMNQWSRLTQTLNGMIREVRDHLEPEQRHTWERLNGETNTPTSPKRP